jgi:putative transposase
VVKPASRKRLVGYIRETYDVSQRRACNVIPISRKAVRYVPRRPLMDAALVTRLKALGEQYPRYGYLMLHELLRRERLVINRKRTYRLYCDLGMQVRTKKRKKLVRPRIPLEVPMAANQRWSLDFVHDQLSDGRRLKVLNIVDDYSRVCVGQLVDLSISGERMARYLDEIAGRRGLPKRIVMDNVLHREVKQATDNSSPFAPIMCSSSDLI